MMLSSLPVELAALPLAQSELGPEFFHNRSNPDCVQRNGAFCVGWVVDNIDRYVTPTLQHLVLVSSSVALGFAIALGLAMLSHRRRWIVGSITGLTGVLYTVPSIAFFSLMIPITGRGTDTAVIALTAYTLQIMFRNIVAGLRNVPAEAKDAGRGMGMTNRQLLWRVELPLAVPEIIAGLRIATVSTVAIATLAVFAGAGGLGAKIYSDLTFKTNIIFAGGIAILMAIAFDALYVVAQRLISPWRRVRPV
jgi:osmoprotectant transport system permease protein